jgi:hypothetical protein
MGADSRNHHNNNSTSLRSLRILSKYSNTNTSYLEFSNNLLCFQRYKNFKKYLLINFVNNGLSIFLIFAFLLLLIMLKSHSRSINYIRDYSKVDVLILVAKRRTCSAKNSFNLSESSGEVLCLIIT